MSRIIMLPFMLLFSALPASAQKQMSLEELIKQTNEWKTFYDAFDVFAVDTYYAFHQLNLTEEIVEKYIKENGAEYDLNETQDSISNDTAIQLYQQMIPDNLKKITAHPDFLKEKDLASKLTIPFVVSDDGLLYNFSFDTQTGGTYREQVSYVYFTELTTENENTFAVFDHDGYHTIHCLPTDFGMKYLLLGYARFCSMCFGNYANLVWFDNEEQRFVSDFYYNLSLRDPTYSLEYDNIEQTLSTFYSTDDLTRDCICENHLEMDEGATMFEEPEVYKNCECTFIFDGNTFIPKRFCWEIDSNHSE